MERARSWLPNTPRAHLDVSTFSDELRSVLDPEHVARTAVERIHRALSPTATSLWLTGEDDQPRLAEHAGAPPLPGSPEGVLRAMRRKGLEHNSLTEEAAAPLITPASGLLGVLHVVGGSERVWDSAALRFLQEAVREAARALEAAQLFEGALAERDKSLAILERVGDAVIVTDQGGTVVQANAAAERLLRRPARQIIGRRCDDVVALMDGQRRLDCRTVCPLLNHADPREAIVGRELWRQRGDARQPVLANSEALRDADGTVREVVHSLRDITKLKEADEAKTLFLATATHELKTPLTVISGFAKTLLHGHRLPEDSREEALRTIAQRADQLEAIIDRLLLSSRIESGQFEVSTAPVSLEPLLRERADALAAGTGRTITISAPEDLPEANADPVAVGVVLDHLLDNAIKFSPDGEAVLVTAHPHREAVQVQIIDHGIGLDPVESAHAFDKFWQAESAATRRFGGSGIGLYIVRSLVEAMGGQVSVHSAPGKGATFAFALVRADRRGAPRPPRAAASPPVAAEPSAIREFMRQMGLPGGNVPR